MASRTGSRRNTRVAKCRGFPGGGAMAGVARLRGGNVICGFAGRRCAIVTGRTRARRHTGMAKRRRFPCRGAVAHITGLRCR
jgi:hypothetical protein